MSKTDSAPTANPGAAQFMGWLMAIDEVERQFIATSPRLRREIWFQAVALVLCPASFGYAVFNVAVSLLGYPAIHALTLAAVAAFILFALDQHYLIQARGDASERIRKAIIKVRAASIAIISLSFVLMVSHTFHEDIERVLAEAKQGRRMELEQSPQYKLKIDEARDAVARAGQAAKRADEIRARIAQLQIEQAHAWEGKKNECEGNTTGNQIRKAGCGPKARGFEATANRLELEIEAAGQELALLGNVGERLEAARQQLAAIDAHVDVDADRSISGSSRKLDALGMMLKTSLSACVAVAFWFFMGLLPDILMYAAQSRMFTHDLFASMRALQNEVMQARIAQLRRALRQQQADRLAPIEVRLAPVARPTSARQSDPAAHEAGYKPEELIR